MAVKPFQLLGDIEQFADDGFARHLFGKTRLAFNRLAKRRRVGRVVWHHFAKPVDLPIWHLQNPAGVAKHCAGLQCSEGDDLRHLLAAIFLLDVRDHLFAPVLAKVDIKVRHRHAVGVEEALE